MSVFTLLPNCAAQRGDINIDSSAMVADEVDNGILEWIVDSGAGYHMVSRKKMRQSFDTASSS